MSHIIHSRFQGSYISFLLTICMKGLLVIGCTSNQRVRIHSFHNIDSSPNQNKYIFPFNVDVSDIDPGFTPYFWKVTGKHHTV